MDTNIQIEQFPVENPSRFILTKKALIPLVISITAAISFVAGRNSVKQTVETVPSPTQIITTPTINHIQPTQQQIQKSCSDSSECDQSICINGRCVAVDQHMVPSVTCPAPPGCSDVLPNGCIRKPPVYNTQGCLISCGQLQCESPQLPITKTP